MMALPDYYQILGVSLDASAVEIRDAYKKAALRSHPDRVPIGSPERSNRTKRFQMINEAYQTLSNDQLRRKYDSEYKFFTFSPFSQPAYDFAKPSKPKRLSPYDLIPSIIGEEFWQRYDPELSAKLTCLGTMLKGRQCRIYKKRETSADIKELKSLDITAEPWKCCELLQAFFHLRFCHHHRDGPKQAILRWYEDQERKPKNEQKHQTRSTPTNDCKPEPASPPPPNSSKSTPRRSGLRSDPAAQDEVRGQNSFYTHQPTWRRYESPQWEGLPVSSIIRERLRTPFSNGSPGHLYVYTSASCPGYRKIGRTVRDPSVRIAEWAAQCGRKITLESTTKAQTPGVEQLERLVFAELHLHRYFELECPKCKSKHIEWFNVSELHARQVISKWEAFLETSPYQWDVKLKRWALPAELEDPGLFTMLETPLGPDDSRHPSIIAAKVRTAVATARASVRQNSGASAAEALHNIHTTEKQSSNEETWAEISRLLQEYLKSAALTPTTPPTAATERKPNPPPEKPGPALASTTCKCR